MNTLAERLKYIRNLRKLSQQEISDKVGIKQPTYQALESGKVEKTTFLLDISRVLNVNPNWLATGQGDMDLGAVFNGENTLAERLKFARKQAGLTQTQLSESLSISQGSLSDLESGRNKSTTNLVKIANILNVNPTWLATGQGDIYQDNNPILDNKNQHIINYPSATISKKQHLPLTDLLFKQSDNLDNLFITSIIGDDMSPILGHLSMVVVDKNKSTLPIINGMIYAIGFDDRILCRYLRQNINNTIQICSELDKQGETLPTDEFFNRYQIMGGVIQYIQSYQWQ